MPSRTPNIKTVVLPAIVLGSLGLVALAGALWAYPHYKVYAMRMSGQAELEKQEFAKRVLIEEARARKESASLLSDAEIARARGVAEANRIIGESLAGNEAYLRYLWIQGLQDGSSEIVYIPTEANLPILEATRNVR